MSVWAHKKGAQIWIDSWKKEGGVIVRLLGSIIVQIMTKASKLAPVFSIP